MSIPWRHIQSLMTVVGLAWLLTFLLFSCKKDDDDEIGLAPEIEFLSIEPAVVKEYQDSITVTIKYTDGDGDLGENQAEVRNLFMTDNRNQITYEFRVSELAPAGSSITIQGNLSVGLKNTAITDGSDAQSVNYSIYMVDRAGNRSNTVTTSSVMVEK